MWRILVADDIAEFQRAVREILEYLTPEHLMIQSTSYAFTSVPGGSPSAKDLLESGSHHVLITDSYFENEGEIIISGKKYDDQILGEGLIRFFIDRKYPLHFFFLTAYRDKEKKVGTVFDEFLRLNSGMVTPISKNYMKDELQQTFPELLRKLAKSLCETSLRPGERTRILNIIDAGDDISSVQIQVEGKPWRLQALCAGWFCQERQEYPERDQLAALVKELLTPDIMAAASLFLGIGGIKQITHLPKVYFNPYNVKNICGDIDKRIEKFQGLLHELDQKVYRLVDPFAEKIATFRSEYEKRKEEYHRLFNNNNEIYDRELERSRNHLRYGTSRSAKKISVVTAKSGDSPVHCGRTDFEIYIPFHEIYGNELCKLGEGKEFILEACIDEESNLTEVLDFDNCERPKLTWNYMMFRHDDPDPWRVSNLRSNFPKYLEALKEKFIEYFGSFFLVFKEDERLRVLNLTPGRNFREVSMEHLIPRRCACKSGGRECFIKTQYLDTIVRNQAYLIFVFLSWRQF